MLRKAILFLALTASLAASAQWQTPSRDVQVRTNNFQAIPLTKTNAQLVFDWIDDLYAVRYTNVFGVLPSGTFQLTDIWPYMTNVDNALSIKWTNTFDRLPDITTNLFGLWPYMTNVDAALAADASNLASIATGKVDTAAFFQLYTNDFNILPDITTNLAGLWPYMTNVDRLLSGVSGVDGQPYASFSYSVAAANATTGAQQLGTAWVALSTNRGDSRRLVVTNGMAHVVTGSDNYWVVPSNGLYQLHQVIGLWQYNTGAVDTWVTANGVTAAAVTSGAARTLGSFQQYVPGLPADVGYWHKSSESSLFNWSAGTTVRVEAATSATYGNNTAQVTYVSVEIRRIGAP